MVRVLTSKRRAIAAAGPRPGRRARGSGSPVINHAKECTMHVDPYLNFNGQCAEAFRFYERVLGGKIEGMMTHGESPMADQVPPGWRDRVMHARLVAGDAVLMGSDSPPEHYEKP